MPSPAPPSLLFEALASCSEIRHTHPDMPKPFGFRVAVVALDAVVILRAVIVR